MTSPDDQAEFPKSTCAAFLEEQPPGKVVELTDIQPGPGEGSQSWRPPEIQLHCDSDSCQGVRIYCVSSSTRLPSEVDYRFVRYTCQNCRQDEKVFALCLGVSGGDVLAMKLGEKPSFGPPVPSRAISLVGPDRSLLLLGRRAENLGFGLGAYAYYRRIVENQRGRLIDEILSVARRIGASADVCARLESARKETQFTRSVELVKDCMPAELLVQGQNPLVLLHSALSEGIHALDDAQCLELARSIRVVLFELADKISVVLRDRHELTEAIARLSKRLSRD